jgi:hypothetical protein
MLWRPISEAPLDGTPILVRCGAQPRDYHLVSYVSGDWMDIHGGYMLVEQETGLPTHYAALDSNAKHDGRRAQRISSHPSVCAMTLFFAAMASLVLGAIVENHFDILPP